jgi:hypothetical protein
LSVSIINFALSAKKMEKIREIGNRPQAVVDVY